MYLGKKSQTMGEWDFSTIISDVAKAYTGVTQAQAAADIAKAQAKQSTMLTRYTPSYPLTTQSSNLTPIILLGAAGFLVYMLMKKD